MENTKKNNDKPTLLGVIVFFVVCFITQYISMRFADYLHLINHYGWKRVGLESLKFVQTPKGSPWLVSNGDHLDPGFGHFLIATLIWLPLCISVLWIVFRLLGHGRLFYQESDSDTT